MQDLAFIQNMPKAELHVHLEGSIQPQTVLKLAKRNNLEDTLPVKDLPGLLNWFTFTNFEHFIVVYLAISNLLRTPDDFELITYEFGRDMARQNIRYREATFTPQTHVDFMDKGLAIEDLLSGLENGRKRAKQDFGVEIRWVFDLNRGLGFSNPELDYDPRPAERTLEFALMGKDRGVVGFGLGGYEVGAPPEPFKDAFLEAKKQGLLSLPHAGETCGPESVWGAFNDLQADRIGHGVRSIEDPALLLEIKKRQIPLELNPTSNICLKVYPQMEFHPLPHLDKMGLPITVNSDDPPLFNTDLVREYQLLATVFEYDFEGITRIARNAFAFSGAEPELKKSLLQEFDSWKAEQKMKN